MSGPKVAIVGPSGIMGKMVTKGFIAALKDKKVAELRVVSTKKSEVVEGFVKEGAKLFIADFAKPETLVQAFSGLDIVISTIGTKPGASDSWKALLDPMVSAGVKIYFPSEFGTNHYTRVKNYKHQIFDDKREHFEQAKSKGLKTIRIMCSDIMEMTFGPWFGFDSKAEVWTLIGKGETPVALTSEKDVGLFTVEAAILAHKNPDCPDLIEFYSDMKTLKGYAEAFDKVAGRPTKLEFTPLDKAIAKYESEHQFEYLLQILFEEGAYNYKDATGNELLNPNEKVWKLKKIEEFAKDTKGRP